jgi:hypothetical protein
VDYGQLCADIQRWRSLAKISTYGSVRENGKAYPLLRLDTPGRPRVLVTAGFHGEEPAGPLALAAHFDRIAARARRLNVGLTVFPCINPSGFEAGTRYNASGEKPNNDFLRYETRPGRLEGTLPDAQSFRRWRVFRGGPKETRALRRVLERLPTPVAALDLHQDNYMRRRATYAYVFGDAQDYVPLQRRSMKHLPIAREATVDPGLRTDRHGLIWFHDGSITDWFFRRGSRWCAALETTTKSPLPRCQKVALEWILGFIGLAASARER